MKLDTYNIFDSRTGLVVGVARTLKAAHRKADRMDMAYGAVRYTVRFVDAAYVARIEAERLATA